MDSDSLLRARVARFYGSIAEVEKLPSRIVYEYAQCIDVLQAREELSQIKLHTFTKLKKKSRQEAIGKMEKRAKLSPDEKSHKVNSFKELSRYINGG